MTRLGAFLVLACCWLAAGVTALPAPALAPAVAALAPDISVEYSPTPAEVGLVMQVLVTVEGSEGADCALLETPEVEGGRLRFRGGPSTQNMSISINGRIRGSLKTQWQFELVPEVEGELFLPPFRFSCRGTEVESDSHRIPVSAGRLIDDLVTLEVEPSTDTLWVGQVLEVSVTASVHPSAEELIPRGGLELQLPWIDGVPGLHPREISRPSGRSVFPMPVNGGTSEMQVSQTRENTGSDTRLVLRAAVAMLATEAGFVQMPESRFSVRLVVESKVERDPFFNLMGRRSVVPTRVLVTDAIGPGPAITVRPTPEAGRPDSFTNAVGRFSLGGSARPREVTVGESCTLSISLRPEDRVKTNLDLVEWPDFAERLTDFRLFGKDEKKGSGSRVLSFELSPKDATVTEIPQLEFAFFDPETERYEVRTVGPFPLTVMAGGDGGLTELALPEEILNDLETIRETLPPARTGGWPAWGAPALAFLLLAFVELRNRSRHRRARDPDKFVRRGARAALEKDLKDAPDPPSVGRAFARYLAARLDGPSGGLTAEEAAERLDDAALADELRRIVGGWEAAYLGGATIDLNATREEARALADRLEAVT